MPPRELPSNCVKDLPEFINLKTKIPLKYVFYSISLFNYSILKIFFGQNIGVTVGDVDRIACTICACIATVQN